MKINNDVLKNEEKIIFSLRELYMKYGYSQFKMSKFEEYDLYAKNKNFLVSDNIIAFTDINGKLMALKPDVTLSIVKNEKADAKGLKKLYYNENVYRVSKGTNSYKEIMQVGLECIGLVDEYNIYEVLSLAAKSLESISNNYILDISHMGIVTEIIKELNVSYEVEKEILKCISDKNINGITQICSIENCSDTNLIKLISTYGSPENVLESLREMNINEKYLNELKNVAVYLEKNGYKVEIDFSVTSDTNYYNGFVFKGFIAGVSSSVLSGGQYDKLMKKLGKKASAIGFAIYLDMLERLEENDKKYDVDVLLIYDDKLTIKSINDAVLLLNSNGKSVMVQKEIPEKIKYRQLLKLNERGVEIIENNA